MILRGFIRPATVALVALVAFGLVTVASASAPSRASSVDGRAVEIAALPCDSARQESASGMLLADETVITVAHVLHETRDFRVRTADGTWRVARIRHLDLERDLAILNVPGARANAIGFAQATTGDAVTMVGAASGVATGEVTRRVRITTDIVGQQTQSRRSGYELALEIEPGDSGAGVVDEAADLVAILFARSTRSGGVAWATSVSEVADILDGDTLPDWQCGPDPGGSLLLEPERSVSSRAPTRLAG